MDEKIEENRGRDDEQRTVEAFAASGVRGKAVGFTEAMEDLYAQADVVLARAGATTLAEIAAFALPSVLVPYPYATDNHQTENAKVFSSRGAGWLMLQKNLEVERVAQRLADAAAGVIDRLLTLSSPRIETPAAPPRPPATQAAVVAEVA